MKNPLIGKPVGGFYYIIGRGRERSERHVEQSEAQPEPTGEGTGGEEAAMPPTSGKATTDRREGVAAPTR